MLIEPLLPVGIISAGVNVSPHLQFGLGSIVISQSSTIIHLVCMESNVSQVLLQVLQASQSE
jgi:hypothetical protein